MEIPVQYRLIYLLEFLFAHQDEKVIVFVSNCETVNLLHHLIKIINWVKCVNRKGEGESAAAKSGGVVDFDQEAAKKVEEEATE